MKEFSCGTKIFCGTGALSALKQLGAKRALVVTDPYFVQKGTAGEVGQLCGGVFEIFDKIAPDPDVQLAAVGTAAVKEFDPDWVIALGGGSAMDCAKAMLYFSGSDAKLAAIPTTSGSGSEVTDFAILTHDGVKHPLVDARLRPSVAILDDALLTQLPRSLIADTGFDVLAHALEGYVGISATPFTDALAKEAFCTVFAALPASFNGRQDVRLKIHAAATMAGMAFNQGGLGLCHAMAHVLGGMFHVPHGRLNAVLLPSVIGCNAHAVQEKYARIARAAGVGGSADAVAVRNLKNGLASLRKQLQMPSTLAQAGIAPEKVRSMGHKIVEDVLKDPCCQTNPIKVEDFMVSKVLEEVTGHV